MPKEADLEVVNRQIVETKQRIADLTASIEAGDPSAANKSREFLALLEQALTVLTARREFLRHHFERKS